ncbi:ABC transporter ATP-binding protein [Clostridium botulinum]|uniref:ABC transporter ATP-binding protein n=2 Tax=Clostridium botulinum TaxID=1491 RepID=A0A9Q1UWN9_CLOBO|nr:ABC transporter ATP-binding protein [Clostridium botulinum V891]KOA73047.1 ABC transporter ATP-binding protein [Clostridium botulinum]MCD3198324.1 AAA family ATPase [Clostridium botulinum C/D]KOA73675.1 ABC transporter ATP-binding protein [Clostridium botulinum]KOA82655.1 ABC transporter ATP-binding protein [Clostridium botulinum]
MKINDFYIRSIEIKTLGCLNGYIKQIASIRNFNKLEIETPITFFVGENGTGKSTLLEAIALNYGFNAEGGSLDYNFATNDSHSDLYKFVKLTKGIAKPKDGFFLRAESFYNLATYIDRLELENMNEYGGRSLHKQSHGESFLNLINNRFRGNGLYILDEPEVALSPQRQLALIAVIDDLLKDGSQFIIATHSPILLSMSNSSILSFDGDEIRKISYEDSQIYKITEMFINNRESILNKLCNNDI